MLAERVSFEIETSYDVGTSKLLWGKGFTVVRERINY